MPIKKILIAPLDWGLGHATRCIPIINYLIAQGNEITIAGEGAGLALIKNQFPEVKTVPLMGYRIWYSRNQAFFFLSILFQLPKLILTIFYEHRWLSNQLKKKSFDFVFSDNRYGLHSKITTSVFITHQLRVISGKGIRLDNLIQKILYKKINQFDECWIPDNEGMGNIGGSLSNPTIKPARFRFIGMLSRLEDRGSGSEGPILVMLSGPEPQRTMLENILLEQLKDLKQKTIFLRGLPASKTCLASSPYLEIYNHMDTMALSEAMSAASIVICRSGYSSIMDLIKLKKKAILIPTPGQTEQIHLGNRMKLMGFFTVQDQDAISLKEGLIQCKNNQINMESIHFDEFEKAIKDLGI